MITYICHQIIYFVTSKTHKLFLSSLNTLEKSQRFKLQKYAGTTDYEQFKTIFPVTTYDNWKDVMEQKKQNDKSIHFVPTSGSTQKIKWIPYTKGFKAELWNATAPWLHDLYTRYPEIKKGTHFWSLSWLPEDMRENQQTDDLEFFVGLEKFFLSKIMTLPKDAAHAPSLEESMKEAICHLLNKKVTLISIWSPTFLLELLELLIIEKEYFIPLMDGQKARALSSHKSLNSELTRILFPDLVLISSWGTSTSKYFAEQLKSYFPHAQFESKGLWATEGVVTIPYRGKFPLAVNSHFYEFELQDSGEIIPSWKLKQGMKVSPILTTASGFFRYKLNDLLLVEETIFDTPTFTFLGRINEVDLVGEKISSNLAQDLLAIIASEFSVQPLSLLAFLEPHAHYQLLIEGQEHNQREQIQLRLEELLNQHFHYKLARELHQLSASEVFFKDKAIEDYIRYSGRQIAIRGNIKLEPLLLVRGKKYE